MERTEAIDLRSDTGTLPTEEMLEAMRRAPLGDDVLGEDPTINKLQAVAAERLGKEAALFVPTGTMGNLVALLTHTTRGDEVLLDAESHIFYYEAGGLAALGGVMPMPVAARDGMMDPAALETAIRGKNVHYPTPRLLCLENTHNRSGGRVIPLALQNELCGVAHRHGLSVHLDGARIFNAAVAAGADPARFAEGVDSVMFCLSKGLSCPVGSLIVGSRPFIERALHNRKRVGGGMRQAGVLAACGLVALDKMVDRLADDHRNARLLAEGIVRIPGLAVDLKGVETNMVNVDHTATGLSTDEILERFKKAGVLGGGRPPGKIRLVTNRHHTAATVAEAVKRMQGALAGSPRPSASAR